MQFTKWFCCFGSVVVVAIVGCQSNYNFLSFASSPCQQRKTTLKKSLAQTSGRNQVEMWCFVNAKIHDTFRSTDHVFNSICLALSWQTSQIKFTTDGQKAKRQKKAKHSEKIKWRRKETKFVSPVSIVALFPMAANTTNSKWFVRRDDWKCDSRTRA